MNIDIKQIADSLQTQIGSLVPHWLPQGKHDGNEWVALNPKRKDSKLGSFKVNLNTGVWCDFATDDKGGDIVSLYAYLHDLNQLEAAKELASNHGLNTTPVQVAGGAEPEFKNKQAERSKWSPILPIPDYAMPSMPVQWHERTPEKIFCYTSKENQPLCFVFRVVKEDGSKVTPPLCFAENEQGIKKWVFRAPEKPRPLFGLANITDARDEVILLVEGEKCASVFDDMTKTEEIAQDSRFKRLAVLSWLGGCKSWQSADWSPLYGKNVILWADNDEVGKKAMNNIASLLAENGSQVRFVQIPSDKPDGWDIADCAAENGMKSTLDLIFAYSKEPYWLPENNAQPDPYELTPSEPAAENSEEKPKKKPKNWKTKEEIQEIWSRFVYIDGTAEIFDLKYNKYITAQAANMAMDGMFKSWNKSSHKKRCPPDAIVFDPTGEKCPQNGYINTFQGLPDDLEELKPVSMPDKSFAELLDTPKKCAAIIQLVKHLCNHDLEIIEWLLNWVALPLQRRGTKMHTAVLMRSSIHGAGKSLFWDTVMRSIYGKYARHFVQADLENSFNANREFCLFGVFEEIFTGKSKYDHSGSLKDLITATHQRIERKHFDAKESENFMNCVFLSNYIQPFPIEENDRRYFVVSPETKLPQDIADAVIEEIKNGGIRYFYRFLISLPLTLTQGGRRGAANGVAFRFNSQPPMTDAKQEIIKWGFSSWQTFYHQWKNGEIPNTPFVSCLAADLWQAYIKWCDFSNEMKMKKAQFIIAISTRVRYKQIRVKHPILMKEIQAYCFLTTDKEKQSDYSEEINQFQNAINSSLGGRNG